MNKSTIVGIVIGGTSVLSLGAVASYQALKTPSFAEVVDVKPLTQAEEVPQEECKDVQVVHKHAAQDKHRVAGTVIGGLLGGVLGHQVGGGNGKTLATVAGAAAGGYAGNQVQKGMQDRDTYTTNEQKCKTVKQHKEKVVGYEVKYLLDGKLGKARMDHQPGDRIPVKDGQLVLNESVAEKASATN
jgi:uncharacterized protein YcfJ